MLDTIVQLNDEIKDLKLKQNKLRVKQGQLIIDHIVENNLLSTVNWLKTKYQTYQTSYFIKTKYSFSKEIEEALYKSSIYMLFFPVGDKNVVFRHFPEPCIDRKIKFAFSHLSEQQVDKLQQIYKLNIIDGGTVTPY